jgi:hypothetical protein
MFLEEARWVLNEISNLGPMSKILDIGSGNLMYRTQKQPHIGELYSKVKEICSTDIIAVDFNDNVGIDCVCDITKKDSLLNFKDCDLILLCNTLEHIDISQLNIAFDNIREALNENAFCIVTVPYNIEFHPAPIDNGLRPTADELISLMSSHFQVSVCTQIECSHYKEPYVSNPNLKPIPIVTCGVFKKI